MVYYVNDFAAIVFSCYDTLILFIYLCYGMSIGKIFLHYFILIFSRSRFTDCVVSFQLEASDIKTTYA